MDGTIDVGGVVVSVEVMSSSLSPSWNGVVLDSSSSSFPIYDFKSETLKVGLAPKFVGRSNL